MKRGFVPTPKPFSATVQTPFDTIPLKECFGYFSYGKCEPEQAAVRFAQIQIREKFSQWMGMSVRRFFAGNTRVWRRTYNRLPKQLPILSDAEMDGATYETIPPPTEKERLFWFCGLRRLERLGVLEVRHTEGEDYLFPTEKFARDLTSSLKHVAEFLARIKTGMKNRA